MNLSRAHIISPIGFNRMRSTHYCALDWTHEQWRKYENKWSVTTRVSWSSSTAYPHGHGREIHLLLLLSYTNNWMKCKKKKKRKEKEKKSSTWTLHSSYSQSSTFLHHFDFSFFFLSPDFYLQLSSQTSPAAAAEPLQLIHIAAGRQELRFRIKQELYTEQIVNQCLFQSGIVDTEWWNTVCVCVCD